MRSAELLQQPACGRRRHRRSIRTDPGFDASGARHDAVIEPARTGARLAASGGEGVVMKGLVHVARIEEFEAVILAAALA